MTTLPTKREPVPLYRSYGADDREARTVTIERNGASWTGTIVGWVDEPCVILRLEDGQQQPIVVDGATVRDV